MFSLRRPPDMIISREGDLETPYMRRWYVIPRNRWFNIYLHEILQPDDERALHDHPWWNISLVLKGGYLEHMKGKPGDIHREYAIWRSPGRLVFRRAATAHRIGLAQKWDHTTGKYHWLPCWSLFITGPRIRVWGFHCPQGWVPFDQFLLRTPTSSIGKGCEP